MPLDTSELYIKSSLNQIYNRTVADCFVKQKLGSIKNFIEDCILEIHNKFFSSKYVLKGKCKKCGKCCRNILFSTKEGYVKSKETFFEMQKKYKYYRNYRKR